MSRARASAKIAEISDFVPVPGTYLSDHEGIIDFFVSRNLRVVVLDSTDGDRFAGAFVDFEEDRCLSYQLNVPLTSLARHGCLLDSILGALARLNLRPNSAMSVARGIASYVDRVVGGTPQVFYTGVCLDVTDTEVVRRPPDLYWFLYESYEEIRLHEEYLDFIEGTNDEEVPRQPVPDLRSLLEEYERRITLDGPRGASEEAIQKLKATSFSITKGADHNLGPCSICLEDLDEETDIDDGKGLVTRTPCSHLFHESCIVTWAERSVTCPLCRRELSC